MNLQAEKQELIKRLEQINDESLLKAIRHIMDYGQGKSEGRVSIDQYNKELEEAEREIDRGEYYTQSEVENRSKKW